MSTKPAYLSMAEILAMDGRKLAPDPFVRIGWRQATLSPLPRASAVHMTVEMLKDEGRTTHSASARLLPYVLSYLEENNIPYEMKSLSADGRRYGYTVRIIDWPPKPSLVIEDVPDLVVFLANGGEDGGGTGAS